MRRQPQRGVHRHGPLQLLPVDVFEHEIIPADVVDLADVRVIERRDRVRFFLKPIAARAGKTLDATTRLRRVSKALYTSPYSCAVKQKERVPQAVEGAAIEERLKGSAGAPRRGGAHRKSRNTDVAVEHDATRADWCVELAESP